MKPTQYPRLNETLYRTRLPSGLWVQVLPRQGIHAKCCYLAADFGSRDRQFFLDGVRVDVPDGTAHFLEHKMFDNPNRDVAAGFSTLGASVNAYTTYDKTAYYFTCTEHFDRCLELLLDFVFHPCFTAESVQKELGIIDQEIARQKDNVAGRAGDLLMEMLYPDHPVTVEVLGTRESIRTVTPELLRQCHRGFYTPSNMTLCVVGDVDPERVAEIAMKLTGDIAVPDVRVNRTISENPPRFGEVCREERELNAPRYEIGFRCDPIPEGMEGLRTRMVGSMAVQALIGDSSELYQRLYEEQVISYSMGGGLDVMKDVACVYVAADGKHCEYVRDAVIAQAQTIAREGIDETLFRNMKRAFLGWRLRSLDSIGSVCAELVHDYLWQREYLRFPEIVEQVTQADIRAFLARVVTPERCAVSVVWPIKKEDDNESQ